ncbi:hypothetical protein LWI28_023948 [Acer negundo]|uniref:Transcriptional factor DELLA N-terminal domain-containing protein n=1 Tax=Acer negundo TaxID=4023 RepID=A0AAD5J2R3_ACENE|nr:hypothetical protein LWI28_023948 [Acer negundo]
MWEDEQDSGGGGMDERLAVLGYKVKSFGMADVTQKLEQLEMVMGSAKEDGTSHLGDTVHYNPLELTNPSTEVASSVVNSNSKQQIIRNQSRVYNDDSEYDLRAIPGVDTYPQADSGSETSRKRMKTSIRSGSMSVGADIIMYVNSPGGSVTAGMAIFDTMKHVRPDVSTLCWTSS